MQTIRSRGLVVGVTLLGLIICLAQPSDAAKRACEESEYCSAGISKHWVGDITTGASARRHSTSPS